MLQKGRSTLLIFYEKNTAIILLFQFLGFLPYSSIYWIGHQGTGVVSYFVFLRWLFFLNFFIFLLCFWVITFFQVAFTEADYDKDTMGVDDSGSFPGVATAETCSDLYKPNVTTDALSLVLDFIQGTVSVLCVCSSFFCSQVSVGPKM